MRGPTRGTLPAPPELTCHGALIVRGDIGVNQLLLHLLGPLFEEPHQLLEPGVDDGAAQARGRTDALGQADGETSRHFMKAGKPQGRFLGS